MSNLNSLVQESPEKDNSIPSQTSLPPVSQTVFPILYTISLCHFLNDTIQSVIPSSYPMIKSNFHLSFTQIGLITLTFQLAASLLQPFVGIFTDRKPQPYSLVVGMSFSLMGLIFISIAPNFYWILFSVAFIGIGSSIFHPESSRVAYMASGGRRGLAQSIFQLGGNAGSALGPLMAAFIIAGKQSHMIWFGVVAILGIFFLSRIAAWYGERVKVRNPSKSSIPSEKQPRLSRARIIISIGILLLLIFSKYFYLASMSSYYTFYLINKFHLSVQQSQIYLFVFLASVAAGTLVGGPLGDRFGRKYVIWVSILGVAPFTLYLPFANLIFTAIMSVFIGIILASAFSAILVYAQELLPGNVGMVAGLFFGFAFGMGGIGSAVLGRIADQTSIGFVFKICSFLPLIGILTSFLPNIERRVQKMVA